MFTWQCIVAIISSLDNSLGTSLVSQSHIDRKCLIPRLIFFRMLLILGVKDYWYANKFVILIC